jgi:hypothetical protein
VDKRRWTGAVLDLHQRQRPGGLVQFALCGPIVDGSARIAKPPGALMSRLTIICDMKKPVCENCLKRFEPVRRDAVTCSPACRQARARRLRAQTPPLPEGTFDLLLLDLPRDWRGYSPKGEGRSPQRHYDTMDVPALCRLGERIGPLMAKNAAAVSWVYGPRLFPDLPIVMEAFGFEYRAEGVDGFDWIKLDNSGRPVMGNGKTTRKGKETALAVAARPRSQDRRPQRAAGDLCAARETA